MMGKLIVSFYYRKIFKKHMEYFVKKEIITKDQSDDMSDYFEVKVISFIKVLTSIGAILVGLGMFLYIASNWIYIREIERLVIIMSSMLTFYIIGNRIRERYRIAGKALIYLSILIYGSGLFLIDQTFNFGGERYSYFLLWTIGIIPMVYIFDDLLIHLFSQIIGIVYVIESIEWANSWKFGHFVLNLMAILIILFLFIKMNELKFRSKISVVLIDLYIVFILLYGIEWFGLKDLYGVALLFVYGLMLTYKPIMSDISNRISSAIGIVITGITGIMLTYESIWRDLEYINDGTIISIFVGILIGAYFLWLIKKGHNLSLVFVLFLIFRYYTDRFYDFLPKSIFFIIGGVVLLVFGIYLERVSKRRGES